jgi:hypothetical protein
MKNLRTLLEESDPLRDEPGLAPADAQTIRRAMLGAVTTMSGILWPRALPVAAIVVLMIAAGAAAGRRLNAPDPAAIQQGAASAAPDSQERRQVQFSTPGGTRIIWTIDPNFQIGVLP